MSNRDREQSQGWRSPDEANSAAQDQTGGVEHGYGQGGRTAFGQIADGGSDMPGRGFGGSNAGGFGQQTQNSQWGQGGMGPMTQGANYSQGGGQFGPVGYQPLDESSGRSGRGQYREPTDQPIYRGATGPGRLEGASGQSPYGSTAQDGYGQNDPRQAGFGPGDRQGGFGQAGGSYASQYGQHGRPSGAAHHDDHEPHYRTWRDNQLASHDRDYARWREEQTRKYDEDYTGWRNERHSTFSKEFEGWRSGRGGQAGGSEPSEPLQGRAATTGTFATDAASEKSVYGAAGSTGAASASSASYANRSDDDRQKVDSTAVHGANPTLAAVADGATGSHRDLPSADDRRKEDEKA